MYGTQKQIDWAKQLQATRIQQLTEWTAQAARGEGKAKQDILAILEALTAIARYADDAPTVIDERNLSVNEYATKYMDRAKALVAEPFFGDNWASKVEAAVK